jgi:SAM-dependent methyltransferase
MDNISPDPIMEIANGFMAAKFLFVANEFSFFDALKDSPVDLAGLAARTGLTERSARILADGCVALGLLHERDGVYSNSAPTDRFLTGGGLAPGLRFWDQISYPAWARFADTLAHGPSHQAVDLPPQTQQVMLDGIEAMLAGPTRALVACVDFSDRRRLLDLGCGTGSWATTALKAHPDLMATLVDLPIAIGVAEKHISAAGLADRATVLGSNILTDPIPAGHDLVMLNNVLHYYAPDTNKSLLARVAQAVEPDALLVLADFWTDPTHTQPLPAALMAGEFAIHVNDGDVYSVEEGSAWLQAAGWRYLDHRPLAGPMSVIIAETA